MIKGCICAFLYVLREYIIFDLIPDKNSMYVSFLFISTNQMATHINLHTLNLERSIVAYRFFKFTKMNCLF